MPTSGNVTKRGSRVTGVLLPPSRIAIAWDMLKRADVLTRLGMCVVAALAIWLITRGWQSPFAFRQGDVPARSITARVSFQTLNQVETDQARERARRSVVTIYRHDQARLYQLREALVDKVHRVPVIASRDHQKRRVELAEQVEVEPVLARVPEHQVGVTVTLHVAQRHGPSVLAV